MSSVYSHIDFDSRLRSIQVGLVFTVDLSLQNNIWFV